MSDKKALIRAAIELPALRHVREQVAARLPDRGYHLDGNEAWSFAGAIMEDYIDDKFDSLGKVYTYISQTGYKIAMDILEDLPFAGQVMRRKHTDG
jgi:hypothetical protein